MTCLHEQKWVNASKADTATLQYDELCRIAKTLYEKEFKEFDMYKSRLDDFMVSILSDKEDLAVLYEVIQMVLILSHGNAQVESGFSINGDILSENLQEESVVAQRQVYDGIHNQGGVLNVHITKEMMRSVRVSHSRYTEALKEKRLKYSVEEKRKAKKRSTNSRMKELKAKKRHLADETEHQKREIDHELKILCNKLNN